MIFPDANILLAMLTLWQKFTKCSITQTHVYSHQDNFYIHPHNPPCPWCCLTHENNYNLLHQALHHVLHSVWWIGRCCHTAGHARHWSRSNNYLTTILWDEQSLTLDKGYMDHITYITKSPWSILHVPFMHIVWINKNWLHQFVNLFSGKEFNKHAPAAPIPNLCRHVRLCTDGFQLITWWDMQQSSPYALDASNPMKH